MGLAFTLTWICDGKERSDNLGGGRVSSLQGADGKEEPELEGGAANGRGKGLGGTGKSGPERSLPYSEANWEEWSARSFH